MSGNTFGKLFTLTTAGESHGAALIGIVDGCPPGMTLTEKDLQEDLDLRKPGSARHTTQRRETDEVKILSGTFEGVTTGTPIALIIENTDQRPRDYTNIANSFRPGHADYTYQQKYGLRDYRGGGRSSARETAIRVAAGGIATGSAMLAVMILGADGVQVGSRFVACEEASSHQLFKKMVVDAKEGDTHLTLKELAPVRMLKNKFYNELQELYKKGPTVDELKALLGRARAKRGMFEGDLEDGELEIGQIAGLIHDIKPAAQIVDDLIVEFNAAKEKAQSL